MPNYCAADIFIITKNDNEKIPALEQNAVAVLIVYLRGKAMIWVSDIYMA